MQISIIKKGNEMQKGKSVLRAAGVLLFWLLLWQIGAAFVGKEILLPSPLAVFQRLLELWVTAAFWKSVFLSVGRIMAGFFWALVMGVLLGAVCYRSKGIHALAFPALSIIKATPVASFIILAMVWLPSGKTPTFIAFLMVLPLIWSSTLTALREVDGNLLEMAKAYRFSPGKKIRYLFIPSVLPTVVSAAATGLGFAWKSGIAAEVLARPRLAIGSSLYDAKIYLEMPELFAWTATIIVLSMLIEKLFFGAIQSFVRRMKLQMEVRG